MSTEKNLTNLVINEVESQDVYDYMKANNLINADELYLVAGAEESIQPAGTELGLVQSGGDVTISSGIITVNDDSHNHIIANIDSLQDILDSKVDAETGKGLSTNDLTATLKSNYDAAYTHSQQAHAPADAEANVIVGVQQNGTDLTVDSITRKVNVVVPTKISDLTNDSDFATTTDLDSKVDKVTGKGLSTNDYTTEEKAKLASIEEGATQTIVDTALSSTSTNPIQNKVINTKLTTMQSDIDSRVPSSRAVNGKALSSDITLSASDVGALPDTTVIPSIEGLATEDYVDTKVAGLVDSAPTTLDTLNELAAALGDDPNFATTVATQIGEKVDKEDGKGLSSNDYTTTEKTKLSSIAEGAEVNQNAFSNVIVGSTTVAADDKTDSLTIAAGDNVTISADAVNDKITISAVDTVYTHPTYTSKSSGLYKITVDGTGHVSATTTVAKSDITSLGIPAQDTTYSEATTSASGLMSSSDKAKLNDIETGAQVNQNAFSNVLVGTTTVAADSTTDTLTFVAGDNVTLTPDATNDKITIAATDTVYTHPSYTAKSSGLYKVTVDSTGHVSATSAVLKSDITGLGIPAQDTTYDTGTETTSGLTKLYTGTGTNTDGTMTQSAINTALDTKTDLANGQYYITTSGDGSAYTATVPGIESLATGVSFIMIPHVVSASTSPTLDVNGLGAKNIRRRLNTIGTAPVVGASSTWLAASKPYRVVYDGTYWIVEGQSQPVASDLYGTLSVAKGGTGATTAEAALTSLGAAAIPPAVPITLSSSGWDSSALTQTVTVSGVSATETEQLIIPTPATASQTAYYDAGILCTGQAENSLTFTATTAPTEDLTVYVTIIKVAIQQ